MHPKDPFTGDTTAECVPLADRRLLDQLRDGDAEAGRRFVHDYYPAVYRYLLYLAGRPDLAEDLAQETFLQAWRHLATFEGRSSLQTWLLRIARREFLQLLRRQRRLTSLEELADPPASPAAEATEAVELRLLVSRLPLPEREAVVLHYLQGYSGEEIARLLNLPVTTVQYRLLNARARLRRELGEGDLTYLNPSPEAVLRRWLWLPLEALTSLEARLSLVGGRWLKENPEASSKGENRMDDRNNAGISRRKLLERAGSAAAAVAAAGVAQATGAAPRNESEIIDDRLTRKITLAVKATALADLCEQLTRETGVVLAAGPSVADEKVTLFCEKLPLREVMRQLSRPFGYTWLRTREASGVGRQALGESRVATNAQRLTPNAPYRYELVQDLRSQLLEEGLRNRDRHAALLALHADIERYRPYLSLSPQEAQERAKGAAAEDRPLLENLGKYGWGPIQLYFRLSPQEQAALRAGQELRFRTEPEAGDLKLPSDLETGILACQVNHRLIRQKDGGLDVRTAEDAPDAPPLTAVPDVRAQARLKIDESEPGQFTLRGQSGFYGSAGLTVWAGAGPWATGMSPSALKPDNAALTARFAHDPALQGRVTVAADGRRQTAGGSRLTGDGSSAKTARTETGAGTTDYRLPTTVSKLTSADVLEALHRATGMSIIADFYTRLYAPEAVSVSHQRLYDALNMPATEMRLRWNKEDDWLQFRSASYYDDRLKEVPNRLLARWTASRHQHEILTLDDLVEIAGLSDAQLDAADMAEGARELWGLTEWDLARERRLRPHLRFLAGFTPDQRREAQSAAGLPFTRMSLAQQQQFLSLALWNEGSGLRSLDELAGATLRVDYTQPGWFTWRVPGPYWLRFIVPMAPDRRIPFPLVRERTREAALQALRRVDPAVREAALRVARAADPRQEAIPTDEAAQIVATERDLVVLYIPDLANKRSIHVLWGVSDSYWNPGWPG